MNNDTKNVRAFNIMYSDSIFHFIERMIRDYHRAEELTQDTFIKLSGLITGLVQKHGDIS